jgi:hypothetical protein
LLASKGYEVLVIGQRTADDASQGAQETGAASLDSRIAVTALTARSGSRGGGGGSEDDEDGGELHIDWILGRFEALEIGFSRGKEAGEKCDWMNRTAVDAGLESKEEDGGRVYIGICGHD